MARLFGLALAAAALLGGCKAAPNPRAAAELSPSASPPPTLTKPPARPAKSVADRIPTRPRASRSRSAGALPVASSRIRALLWRIALCESGGRFDAVSASGTYRGAWQFNRSTWASYGPAGDPAKASPAEQWRRALALYRARGVQPWPVCGPRALR